MCKYTGFAGCLQITLIHVNQVALLKFAIPNNHSFELVEIIVPDQVVYERHRIQWNQALDCDIPALGDSATKDFDIASHSLVWREGWSIQCNLIFGREWPELIAMANGQR